MGSLCALSVFSSIDAAKILYPDLAPRLISKFVKVRQSSEA